MIANPPRRLAEDSHLTDCKSAWTPNGRKVDLKKISAHQLISDCTTAVGRAHISCYASAQQLLCGWRDRHFRLILLVLLATSKGYSEDYLR